MKIVPQTKIETSEHTILSASISLNVLVRIDLDTYALYEPFKAESVLEFRSMEFSRLLNSLTDAIVKIDIYKKDENASLIHLYLQNGQIAAFESKKGCYAINTLEGIDTLEKHDFKSIHTYYENLPNAYPLNRMFVGESFINQIKCSTSNPSKILQKIWSEYRHTMAMPPYHNDNESPVIITEFGNFITREYRCGRVAFIAA